jgi:hypothetical protein
MSLAQSTAHRANAQKSTGPTSAAGKAKVALTARKHGLAASQIVFSALVRHDTALSRTHDRAFRQLQGLREKTPLTKQSQFSAQPRPPNC